jgi:VanZ family protein
MPTLTKKFIFRWLPLIAYCLFIFIQSGYPSPQKLPSFNLMDKMLHFAAYGVMSILFYRAYQTLRIKNHRQMLIFISIVSASIYGISDEIHQYFVPERHGDLLDVIADILGAICGTIFYQWWVSRKKPVG